MRTILFHVAIVLAAIGTATATPQVLYDDALRNAWQDWSWGTHDLAATAYVHTGSHSVSFPPANWDAISFWRSGGASGATYDGMEFWINGGTASGQNLRVVFEIGGTQIANNPLTDFLPGGPQAGRWTLVRVPFDQNGVGTQTFDRVYVQEGAGQTQPAVYLDDVVLTERAGGGPPSTTVTVTIDRNAARHAVSPLVYGVNWDVPATAPHYPVQRWGGNSVTRYNWQADAQNSGSDWFFIGSGNSVADVSKLPDGSRADTFIDAVRARGAEALMTAPLLGWVEKDRAKRWGFSIAKYGAQQLNECTWQPGACAADAGNGVRPDGSTNVTGNDPADTSMPVDPVFVKGWMAHIAGRVGTAANGGVRYWDLDNEPGLWNSTHRDVHPAPLDASELWQRTRDYARAIKDQDPAAQTFGPVPWGWCEYFYSAKDGCGPGADYAVNGPLLEWYLAQVESYRRANHGIRLVDWLDIHYYPQASNVALSSDESAATSALRLRSLKSLYDRSYTDESWIGQPVYLVPRMKDILARRSAPGTKLAITEYSFGNDDGLSSALAQVEALAIFGREGVDLATRWSAPAADTRVEDAFRVFLDYDHAGAGVSGDSVRATSANVDDVGAYAIRGNDGRLFVVLVNKATEARTVPVSVGGGFGASIALFGFDGASRLHAMGTVSPSGGGFSIDMAARSAVLAVGPLAPCAVPATVSGLRLRRSGGNLQFTWTDLAGVTDYVVQHDQRASGPFLDDAGTATSGTTGLTVPQMTGTRFYLVAARNACGTGDVR